MYASVKVATSHGRNKVSMKVMKVVITVVIKRKLNMENIIRRARIDSCKNGIRILSSSFKEK